MSETTTANNWQEPTQQQIDAWKKKYNIPFIKVFSVEDRDGSIKKAWYREARLDDLRMAKQSENKRALTFGESLYNNCRLSAHPDIEASEYLKEAIIMEMDKIQVTATVDVGNV